MFTILLSAIVISFSGAAMPGPMFAVTVAKSYKNSWAGAQASLGHAVVEVPIILLIYFGFSQFFEEKAVQMVLSLAGGAMIIWLGLAMFRSRTRVMEQGGDFKYSAFQAGIITTGLNPAFYIWWATVGSLLVMRFLDYSLGWLAVFIVVHWMVDLVWLSFVSLAVNKTNHFWGARFQEGVFIACSLLLVGFGIYFIVSGTQLVI